MMMAKSGKIWVGEDIQSRRGWKIGQKVKGDEACQVAKGLDGLWLYAQ
jgi:hypothetical protein